MWHGYEKGSFTQYTTHTPRCQLLEQTTVGPGSWARGQVPRQYQPLPSSCLHFGPVLDRSTGFLSSFLSTTTSFSSQSLTMPSNPPLSVTPAGNKMQDKGYIPTAVLSMDMDQHEMLFLAAAALVRLGRSSAISTLSFLCWLVAAWSVVRLPSFVPGYATTTTPFVHPVRCTLELPGRNNAAVRRSETLYWVHMPLTREFNSFATSSDPPSLFLRTRQHTMLLDGHPISG
jgi:hypothetical protein